MENQPLGLIDHWIRNIKDVYEEHLQEVQAIESQEQKINRLCELNVQRQVLNVCHSPSVQKAWKNGQDLTVHGLIYSLKEGTLNNLNMSISSLEDTSSVYEL
jgi:carbonic anhydrase